MGSIEGDSPKGGPVFTSTPQTTADFNRLREYVEQQGNAREGTVADMNELLAPEKYPGLLFFTTDVGILYVVDKTNSWVILATVGSGVFAEAAGTVLAGAGNNLGLAVAVGGVVNTVVTFPAGRFTASPVPVVMAGSGRFTATVIALSATQMTVQLQNNSAGPGVPGGFYWQAKQMDPA